MAQLRLEEMLKKRKMSRYRFAQLEKKHYNTVVRYFRDGYDPKLSTLERWARILKCRIRDLYRE